MDKRQDLGDYALRPFGAEPLFGVSQAKPAAAIAEGSEEK
jgi:hypothetical protein